MAITTILWDLDGTLVNSESDYETAMVKATNRMGKSIQVADLPSTKGIENKAVFRHLFGVEGDLSSNLIYQEWYRLVMDYVYRGAPKMVAIPQSMELVRKFSEMGLAQSIVSNSYVDMINLSIANLGIKEYMTNLIGADCVELGKPSPDLYLEGMARHSASPENCLVFEDSPSGIQAATDAKIKNIIRVGAYDERLLAYNCSLVEDSWLSDILTKFF